MHLLIGSLLVLFLGLCTVAACYVAEARAKVREFQREKLYVTLNEARANLEKTLALALEGTQNGFQVSYAVERLVAAKIAIELEERT